jgi:hypothetical protein
MIGINTSSFALRLLLAIVMGAIRLAWNVSGVSACQGLAPTRLSPQSRGVCHVWPLAAFSTSQWLVRLPAVAVVVSAFIPAHQVGHCLLIPAGESFSIGALHPARNILRTTIFIAIVNIRLTAVLHIFASAFDSILVAAPLDFIKLTRRSIPCASTAVVPVLAIATSILSVLRPLLLLS